MAALLKGEGELVLPAVPGLLWGYLQSREAGRVGHQ